METVYKEKVKQTYKNKHVGNRHFQVDYPAVMAGNYVLLIELWLFLCMSRYVGRKRVYNKDVFDTRKNMR